MSFLGNAGGARRVSAALLKHRLISATAGTAAAVIVAGCAFAAASTSSSTSTSASTGSGSQKLVSSGSQAQPTQSSPAPSASPVAPLRLLSASPSGGTKEASGVSPVTLTFSAPLSSGTPLPTISPEVAGSWKVSGAKATFTPADGFAPDTKVTVSVPGGSSGVNGSGRATLAKSTTVSFTTGSYSNARLDQLLAQLGYLPLSWTPTSGSGGGLGGSMSSQVAEAYDAPQGSFSFDSGYPSELTSQWSPGTNNNLVIGAVWAFEADQGLAMDGDAGPEVWSHLLTAAVKKDMNPNGYTYGLATQGGSDENFKVWHDGKQILDTPANTGIAGAPTKDGTYPVYDRLSYQVMKGTNPNGTKYSDPVHWIAYFDGGDAVHGFQRASYGWYQSVGCVELPVSTAQFVWPYLTYGTLVTVQGPEA